MARGHVAHEGDTVDVLVVGEGWLPAVVLAAGPWLLVQAQDGREWCVLQHCAGVRLRAKGAGEVHRGKRNGDRVD